MDYYKIDDYESLLQHVKIDELVDFIHYQSVPYEDSKLAIRKAINYAFSLEIGKGGFLILAICKKKLIGASVVNYSGMEDYIPNIFLVYIAVSEKFRGQGIGASIIENILGNCRGSIALHVEYDNPARHLYERLGFTSKYAEMRLDRV